MLSNLFIYCLPCRKLEGCLAKHFRTVSFFPWMKLNSPSSKKNNCGRSKIEEVQKCRSSIACHACKFCDCDGASAFLRFSTANAYFRWSSSRKNDKPPNEFESDGPVWYASCKKLPRFQGHFHLFILLIICLFISNNINFSPFCHPLFPHHVTCPNLCCLLWKRQCQLSSKELLRNLSLPIYQIFDAKYLTQLLGKNLLLVPKYPWIITPL